MMGLIPFKLIDVGKGLRGLVFCLMISKGLQGLVFCLMISKGLQGLVSLAVKWSPSR